ncbi:MAG: hypothetical protein CL799_09820 [Chromatiales bacterium]|nr:hypothetical protein [Chromatiales bacterium]MDP7271549.1 D-arabinono-1,4-lactone oxidase [Gammaproteobacteria bacterium]HJP05535.1 D-arabinono-1,4-lactone oxidase [Gammaproteobacteria bacterium]
MLGIVYSATLRIRPIRSYTIRNTKVDIDEFVRLLPNLMEVNAAVKVSLMPFRDRAYIEIRYPDEAERRAAALPWKLRDWATNSAMPKVIRSVNRVLPVKNLRDPLIDTLTEASHALSSKLVASGSNSIEQTGSFKKLVLNEETGSSTWLFSIANLASVIPAFRKFCERHYRSSGYRCDLPAEARRVDQDQYALLSPSFEGPLFALTMRSTNMEGWDDFLLEFAEFAVHFKGIPLFNQTRGVKPRYATTAYGDRLRRFRDIRKKLDPRNRLLSQFFVERLG